MHNINNKTLAISLYNIATVALEKHGGPPQNALKPPPGKASFFRAHYKNKAAFAKNRELEEGKLPQTQPRYSLLDFHFSPLTYLFAVAGDFTGDTRAGHVIWGQPKCALL
jgi:hypothetical protein